MSEPAQTRAGFRSLQWLWLTAPLVILDQLTKWIVSLELDEFDKINILPFFDLVRYHNEGAAFSFLAEAGGWQKYFFSSVAALVSAGILWYQWTLPRKGCRVLAAGLAMILAGAIGNLIDRLLYGYVIDFLLLYYEDLAWPAFNVADSAITVGVAFVLFDGFFLEKHRRGQSTTESA
ncbi:MAG: lipoprotein signal peptidase [Gammaproteobacteria bacterium]|nr:lipoprotein signal peptidase [Gammaproteobacteria bacterium]